MWNNQSQLRIKNHYNCLYLYLYIYVEFYILVAQLVKNLPAMWEAPI